jgi:hypothetical protein
MNERRYGILSLILAIIVLTISILCIIITVLWIFGRCPIYLRPRILRGLWFPLWAWMPGLVIAVVALKMTRHVKEERLRILSRNVSLLAIKAAIFWAILVVLIIIAALMHPFI